MKQNLLRKKRGVKSNVICALQKRFGSQQMNHWDIQKWSFYDYVRYPAGGTTELNFFAIAQGGIDPVSSLSKTLEQTNCPKTRSFGNVVFVLEQIRTCLHILPKQRQPAGIVANNVMFTSDGYSALDNTLVSLAGNGVLYIKIGQKDYFDVAQPFIKCPPAMGVNIIQHAASKQAGAAAEVGIRSIKFQQSTKRENIYKLTPKQVIEPEQTFEVKIQFNAGTSPALPFLLQTVVNNPTGIQPFVDIGMYFDGYIARNVQ